MKDKTMTLLGFAQKAGKIVSGETGCLIGVKQKKIYLIVYALDGAKYTMNQIKSLCHKYDILCLPWGSKIDLGNSIGKSPRTVIGILDKDFALAIQKTMV